MTLKQFFISIVASSFAWIMTSINVVNGQDASPVEQLSELLLSYESIEGRFQQYLLDAGGTHMQESDGMMVLAKPNRFVWNTNPPYAQELISDGRTVWIFDPDLEQVTVNDVSSDLMQTPALLLSGNQKNIEDNFTVSLQPSTDDIRHFKLVPLAGESLYESIGLVFRDSVLMQMTLVDTLEQKTAIIFSDILINKAIDDAMFTFTIPDGVDVIRSY